MISFKMYSVVALICIALMTVPDLYAQPNNIVTTNETTGNINKSININDIFYKYILPIFGVMGAFSFGLSIYDLYHKRIGFLRPKLECSYNYTCNESYLISKTKIENSSRRPIYLELAFLLIEDHPTSNIQALSKLRNKVSGFEEKRKKTFETTFELDQHSIIKLLPYYYAINIRVGSDAQMATTDTHRLKHSGTYSIYFVVIGKKKRSWNNLWLSSKYDPSHARSVHDEITTGLVSP